MQNKLKYLLLFGIVIFGIYVVYTRKNNEQAAQNKQLDSSSQSSREYAGMGREVWSAFQCSSWASFFDDIEEQERLFLFGYRQGQKFLGALTAGKIEEEDISQEVPIGINLLLAGPSEEFILGRISMAAEDNAFEDVYKTGESFNSDILQESIARKKFQDGNCKLIGK